MEWITDNCYYITLPDADGRVSVHEKSFAFKVNYNLDDEYKVLTNLRNGKNAKNALFYFIKYYDSREGNCDCTDCSRGPSPHSLNSSFRGFRELLDHKDTLNWWNLRV